MGVTEYLRSAQKLDREVVGVAAGAVGAAVCAAVASKPPGGAGILSPCTMPELENLQLLPGQRQKCLDHMWVKAMFGPLITTLKEY